MVLLQLEERRQSDASHKDATRKSRGAVTQDNPVWQAIRYALAFNDNHHANHRKHSEHSVQSRRKCKLSCLSDSRHLLKL